MSRYGTIQKGAYRVELIGQSTLYSIEIFSFARHYSSTLILASFARTPKKFLGVWTLETTPRPRHATIRAPTDYPKHPKDAREK